MEWDILDVLFAGGLVRHQIESYDEFIDKKLQQIIQGFNTNQICYNYNPEIGDFNYKIYINVLSPALDKPVYINSEGAKMVMTPHMARMNNLTYASCLYVKVHVITETINKDKVIERHEVMIPDVNIGKIPIMVRSKACILTQMPGVAEAGGTNECRYDPGGYFIINGNEKVVISQDRISENKTLVFAPNGNADGLVAEIRSMPDGVFLPPKTTSLHMTGKPNHMGRVIKLSTSFLRGEIPLFVMFRALGVESDYDVLAHVLLDVDDPKNARLKTDLLACIDDGSDIYTATEARAYMLRILSTTGAPREFLDQPERANDILMTTIRNDFLPHVGTSLRKKALYLGYMVRKLLRVNLGYQSYDNRDSYIYKRIDTPGVLFANLFRQCYGKMIKEMRNLILRELNQWRAYEGAPSGIITPNNVHRFFKQPLMETGLRYALSTGNWGVKTLGTYQNIRQGVAQVLNRMSYPSTLSHLRRINTPMEKNGKLVQPRKLDNTQYGMICPAECFDPETPILLWDGNIVKANDIKVGDYLIDDSGNSVRVKSTCAGYKTMYDIIPDKKNFMSYTVTDNHILTLKVRKYKNVRNKLERGKKELMWFDKNDLKFKYKEFDNEEDLRKYEASLDNDDVIDITIEKYLSLPKNVQEKLYTFKSSGINWEHKDVALDPYILGMWLGDGLSCGYGFVTADNELLEKWIEWGRTNDATITKGIKYKYHINRSQAGIPCNKTEKAPLKKLLNMYNLVKNKHIPLDYLVNDRKTRLAVLAGLIDTDGNVRAGGHEIRICQGEANYQIIYDAEFLARSLGFSCHVNDGMCSYTVNGEKRKKPYKELTITGQYLYEIPTVLPRKKLNKFEKRCSSFIQSSFKLVQKDVQPFVGWQVEGNGRFLLGDMSVVHNTPEGASVGLVKNMALSTHITVNVSSAHVRELLTRLPIEMYNDGYDNMGARAYLKAMGGGDAVHVYVNGDCVGYTVRPTEVYAELKHSKRTGVIPPTAAVFWDIKMGVIHINTEAGRMTRPLYIAKGSKLALDGFLAARGQTWKEYYTHSKRTFADFLAPMDGANVEEGFIEYMDVEEFDHSMVAMNVASLKPHHTHVEIHPSLMSGVLAANIPFMNHNQSPRNCYQCLWEGEPVLMEDGTTRAIKDLRIGDEVICFDPKTSLLEPTTVIHQYTRPADKPVYSVTLMSGRRVILTNDHKMLTLNGWRDLRGFAGNTLVGVTPTLPARLSMIAESPGVILETVGTQTSDARLSDMGLLPLNVESPAMLTLARMVGFMKARGLRPKFEDSTDAVMFDDDARRLGFSGGRTDPGLEVLLRALEVDRLLKLPSWIPRASPAVRREFIGGFLGGRGNVSFLGGLPIDPAADGFRYNLSLQMEWHCRAEYARYVAFMNQNAGDRLTFEEWRSRVVVKGAMIFMPVFNREPMRNCMVADITVAADHHSFIGGDGIAVSNSAMGKQALGVYMSNFNHRIDTMAHVLNYPQKQLVGTRLSKYTYGKVLPGGFNAIVAIMTHSGFNQEDSVMVNKSALDRGLFSSTYYKSYRDLCTKNHSTGEEEVFRCPGPGTSQMKPYNYDKLAADGFVPLNTYVNGSDILIGKVMPHKAHGIEQPRDTSHVMKMTDEGMVDRVYTSFNGDGYRFCKVRLRQWRKPVIGDKLATSCAQKGTIGMVYRQEDMPFTQDGIVPDIIMNPHAIPSRMTMGQLMECIMGKAACELGVFGDGTPFNGANVDDIADVLESCGMERYGNEILYNGRTGQMLNTEIFIGPTFYQRLKHMVADKNHVRGSTGPIILLTHQPAEGRARNGGLRIGEMERDAIISHGASAFIKEKMLDCSDNYRVFMCTRCGLFCTANPERGIYTCQSCKNNTHIVQLRIPYAFKLLAQELITLGVAMRFNVEK